MNTELQYRVDEMSEDVYRFNYDFDYKSISPEDLEFQFEHSVNVLKETEQIAIAVLVHLGTRKDDLVHQGIRALFTVTPIDEFIKGANDEGVVVSTPRLIETFIAVSIGAIRGLLVKNLKGTPLDGIVLPLVPMNIISQNAVKNISERLITE